MRRVRLRIDAILAPASLSFMRIRVCLGVLLGLATLAGCAGEDRRAAAVVEGQSQYERGDYERAIESLSKYLNQQPRGGDAALAYYIRGLSAAKANRRSQAYDDLRQSLASKPDADTEWRANVVLGVMNFEDERWDAAGQGFTAALRKMPKGPPTDTVLFRLGQCQERTGQWAAARATFQKLVSQYGSSASAAGARRRVAINADCFAVQCGAFTRRDNAERQSADLRRQGYSSYVRNDSRDGKPISVVLVGRYRTYGEAWAAVAQVRGRVRDAVMWP